MRRSLTIAASAVILLVSAAGATPASGQNGNAAGGGDDEANTEIPTTGKALPQFAEFDKWMVGFMDESKIPGGSLAIARHGRVIYARGYGYADRETKELVQPDSLFRIASVSKPITAAAIMRLVERGKLKLDDKVFDLLALEPHLEEGAKFDERWRSITIENCLTHTGGWDRDKSYDPMFQQWRIAASMKLDLPVETENIVRYMMGQPLDFDPGERYAYSNFGYCILGRVIEHVSGKPYEQFVQEEVFSPLGVTAPRIGHSIESERAEKEVKYYEPTGAREKAVVGPGAGKDEVPISYGAWYHESLDSHGGWIASTADLVRFAASLDSDARTPLLKPDSIQALFAPGVLVREARGDEPALHYGYGWRLRKDADDRTIADHGGALPCTAAMLLRLPDDVNVAVLFNLGKSADGQFLGGGLPEPLMRLVDHVKDWPEHDLLNGDAKSP